MVVVRALVCVRIILFEILIQNDNNNRGGYCNASDPLAVDLPRCQGPLETSPEEGGWVPEVVGALPLPHMRRLDFPAGG